MSLQTQIKSTWYHLIPCSQAPRGCSPLQCEPSLHRQMRPACSDDAGADRSAGLSETRQTLLAAKTAKQNWCGFGLSWSHCLAKYFGFQWQSWVSATPTHFQQPWHALSTLHPGTLASRAMDQAGPGLVSLGWAEFCDGVSQTWRCLMTGLAESGGIPWRGLEKVAVWSTAVFKKRSTIPKGPWRGGSGNSVQFDVWNVDWKVQRFENSTVPAPMQKLDER